MVDLGPGNVTEMGASTVEQHPVMVQFVNLLRGIYESKDVPAMTTAVQTAASILLSEAFKYPTFTIKDLGKED